MLPEIYAEMYLKFDNDFDVNTITEILQIQPYKCVNRIDTRINPITKQHNPGYWMLKSRTFNNFDAKYAIDDLISNIEDKVPLIKEICTANNGEVAFEIVPSFYYKDTPAIYFKRKFLRLVSYLDAEMEIDMYTCY